MRQSLVTMHGIDQLNGLVVEHLRSRPQTWYPSQVLSSVQPSGVTDIEARKRTPEGYGIGQQARQDWAMTHPQPDLTPDDWSRICDALRYQGRDLHHRSFAVTAERRQLLWAEMDRCLELADRLSSAQLAHADQDD